MPTRKALTALAAAALVVLASAGAAWAARVRYHFVPANPNPAAPLQLSGGGERLTWSARWEPYNCPPPRPTCAVTFRHPCTGRNVVVPLYLPLDSLPRMEYRTNSTVYDYGSYTVEVRFLPDGSVYVVYNSGLLRAL
ncbi:MAG TPA: hypothetical protein VFA26_22100 [Gemmataceae bacterium]|nr:hypothetical protein [Gemmataceae bacterium]